MAGRFAAVKVTVVLSAYNSARTVAQQLSALANQSYNDEYEVVLADNGSRDNTISIAQSFAPLLPSLRVVDASSRRGVAHARNEGARAAHGEYLLFCDGDDEVGTDWIENMASALAVDDLVGGALELDRLNDPSVVAWRLDPEMTRLPRAMKFLPYAVGANFGIRATTYETLGGCDVRYVNGHDEVELCWRAQLAGFSISFTENAVVHYRLRTKWSHLARQRFGYGRTYAQLFAQYAHLGIEPGQISADIRCWIGLVSRSGALLHRESGGRWIYAAAWHSGRLAGGLRHHVRCPF